jgi:hypothetical protein
MKISVNRQRGRPVYVPTEAGTISLVPEVRVVEIRVGKRQVLRLRRLVPQTIFVIDDLGVRPVRITNTATLVASVLLATALLWGVVPFVLRAARRTGNRQG